MLDDELDHLRNRDDHSPAKSSFADKSGNRISLAKAAPGVSGKADSPSSAPALNRRPRLELSLTQILGSTAAAVTAAFLGSRLGVAGTLIGAALASVISVVGGAVYTTSLKATRRRVTEAIVAVRNQDDNLATSVATAPLPPVAAAPRPPRAMTHPRPGRTSGRPATRPEHAGSHPGTWQPRRRPVLRGVLVGAALSAAVFAGALVVVTGYESVSGTALSGGAVGGLTILGGDSDVSDKSTRTRVTTTVTATTTANGRPTSSHATSVTSSPTGTTSAAPTTSTPAQQTTDPAATPTDRTPVPTTTPTTDPTAPTTNPTTPTTNPATPPTGPAPTTTPDVAPDANSSIGGSAGVAPPGESTTVVHSGPAR